jgi:hypothetical protein
MPSLKVVDRLLRSPHYGEKWGRHWLDVARYSDSNGLDENIALGTAWRYRDYVVKSINADKPFDQFLTEQLAGDLLESKDIPRATSASPPPPSSISARRCSPSRTRTSSPWMSSTSRSTSWAAPSWA